MAVVVATACSLISPICIITNSITTSFTIITINHTTSNITSTRMVILKGVIANMATVHPSLQPSRSLSERPMVYFNCLGAS